MRPSGPAAAGTSCQRGGFSRWAEVEVISWRRCSRQAAQAALQSPYEEQPPCLPPCWPRSPTCRVLLIALLFALPFYQCMALGLLLCVCVRVAYEAEQAHAVTGPMLPWRLLLCGYFLALNFVNPVSGKGELQSTTCRNDGGGIQRRGRGAAGVQGQKGQRHASCMQRVEAVWVRFNWGLGGGMKWQHESLAAPATR